MSPRPPIDTAHFMSRYHHPKNIAIAEGQWATISTAYSKANGMYRQKQVDDEIDRIRSFKRPSSSKITITIDSSNLLRVYHHHHHCLDIQLTGGRNGKGRVVWFWERYETATDERVMKGAIATLDSSWSYPKGANGKGACTSSNQDGGTKAATSDLSSGPSVGEKRKRAAVAAESRAQRKGGSGDIFQEMQIQIDRSQEKKAVIDLT